MIFSFETNPDTKKAKLFDEVGPRFERMLDKAIERGGKWTIGLQRPVRTPAQNNGLHLMLNWLAQALNESGNLLTLKYFGKEFEVQWNEESVKERIWRPMMVAVTGKNSSAKLTTAELSKVADELLANLSRELGIVLQFPSELSRQLGIKPFEVNK